MRARSITRAKCPVEVEGSADETQVREHLGEIAEGLTAPPCFLSVQPKMVGVAEHLLEDQTGLVQRATIDSTGPCDRFDQPECAGVERPLLTRELVGCVVLRPSDRSGVSKHAPPFTSLVSCAVRA